MNSLELAIETTTQIRDALAAEIAVARDERVFIRNMDVEGLNRRAAKRDEFNQKTAGLQRALTTQLQEAALGFGLSEASIESIAERAPVLGELMSKVLAEVRALAAALSELDGLNRMLGRRALTYIRAHLAVLCPKPSAYDRRGGSATASRASTIMRVL